MTGVNLSQPLPEEEEPTKRSFFDASTIISFSIIALLGATWGGMQFYMSYLDKKIATIDMTLGTDLARTKGDAVNRIADFDARLDYFVAHKEAFPDPAGMFQKLESAMVSGVVLTDFKYNQKEKEMMLDGYTDDFKKLAEQVLGLKSEKTFSRVLVDQIGRDSENRIVFTLRVTL